MLWKKIIFYMSLFFLLIIVIKISLNLWSKTEIGSRLLFEADYKQMEKVANYLLELEDDSVTIIKPFGQLVVGPRKYKKIEDWEIKFTVFLLYVKGYDTIAKNSNQTVFFQRWYDGFERYRGYAFSGDGSDELIIDFLVEQKKMPKITIQKLL